MKPFTFLITLTLSFTVSAASLAVRVIDAPWSAYTTPFAINNSEQVVGTTGVNDGFLYSGGVHSAFQRPGAIGGVFVWGTTPTGITDSGLVFGTSTMEGYQNSGFLYANGSFTDISYPGASGTYLYGASTDGTAVGNFWNGDWHGFLWREGVFTSFDAPVVYPENTTFQNTSYYSVNTAGLILGGQAWSIGDEFHSQLFIWDGINVNYLPELEVR